VNILGYAQHGGTTLMDWKLIHIPNLEIIGPKILIHESQSKCWVKFSMLSLGSMGCAWRCEGHPILHIAPHYLWSFISNVSTKPLKLAMHKCKWALDCHPTQS
jgi:hypothetical protein